MDKFIEVFNALSFDHVSKNNIIDEVNSIPQFEADRLCEIVRKELEEQKTVETLNAKARRFGTLGRSAV